MNVDSGLPIR